MKAGVFAVLQYAIGFGVAFAVTGSAATAMGVALVGANLGSLAYLLYERAWRALRHR